MELAAISFASTTQLPDQEIGSHEECQHAVKHEGEKVFEINRRVRSQWRQTTGGGDEVELKKVCDRAHGGHPVRD